MMGGQPGEELQGLGLQTGFMEIQQTFDLIRPTEAIFGFGEERDWAGQGMKDDPTGLAPFRWHQGRIQAAQELSHLALSTRVDHEIQPGCADQIQSGDIPSRSKYSADGDVMTMELAETA